MRPGIGFAIATSDQHKKTTYHIFTDNIGDAHLWLNWKSLKTCGFNMQCFKHGRNEANIFTQWGPGGPGGLGK